MVGLKINTYDILNIIQTIALICTLIILFKTLSDSIKFNKVVIDFQITQSHRELWNSFINNPKLERILDSKANLKDFKITSLERVYVYLIFSHLYSVFQAYKNNIIKIPSESFVDVKQFLKLPIPKEIWKDTKKMYEKEFIDFVEK